MEHPEIPEGPYCYEPLGIVYNEDGVPCMKIKKCPHYSRVQVVDEEYGEEYTDGHCALLNETGGALLYDACKICGINDDWENDGE